MAEIILKPGREKSVLLRHPWIFESAINTVDGKVNSGDTVYVVSSTGERLGTAAFSQSSQIRARMWSWDANEIIDDYFFISRITKSIMKRQNFVMTQECDAYRLVFGESDELPGLIIDQYGKTLVVQVLSAGVEKYRFLVFDILARILPDYQIYERSDADVRDLEGLPSRIGIIKGERLPDDLWINEYGIQYLVDIENGQKTGFYLDQRENRSKIQRYSKDKDVLNCFCFTGGFTLNALKSGAKSVLSIDSSQPALDQMKQNILKNSLDINKTSDICGDVFIELRKLRDRAASFDLIVLDPPKFAPTISQAEKAARGYKDINLLAIKLLRPGGVLFTFSCSGGISRELFQKIVAGAAIDAGCSIQIIEQLTQAADHPVALNFPESMYLKGLVCVK